MFQVLRDSRVTLNFHGDVVAHAANCRLFEATGVGAALVTDAKPNLGELFDVGRELLAFREASDCAATIERALEDRTSTEEIAMAGQHRTLRKHTYRNRMERFLELISSLPTTGVATRR
jgi:spore maturation protein CgeB